MKPSDPQEVDIIIKRNEIVENGVKKEIFELKQ